MRVDGLQMYVRWVPEQVRRGHDHAVVFRALSLEGHDVGDVLCDVTEPCTTTVSVPTRLVAHLRSVEVQDVCFNFGEDAPAVGDEGAVFLPGACGVHVLVAA